MNNDIHDAILAERISTRHRNKSAIVGSPNLHAPYEQLGEASARSAKDSLSDVVNYE